MSKNILQVYQANPITTNQPDDLMYFGRAPYGVGDDAAMQYLDFAAQFGKPYTASALTKVDDANVTMTLTGTPTTALLKPVTITLGWTGLLAIARGGTGVGSVTTVPTATAFAGWDANKNLSANNFLEGTTLVTNSGGTTVLTVSSAQQQIFSGVSAQTVEMPAVATLASGQSYRLLNDSSASLSVISSGSNAIVTVQPMSQVLLTFNGVAATDETSWDVQYTTNYMPGTGTVNSGLINQVAWYAASGTAVSGLATANSGVLVTSAGGVPSISTTLPDGLAMGTPASLTLTNATGLPVGGISATGTPSASTFLRGDGTWATSATVTPSALTKTDDTNVTLTLGGTPTTALLQAVSLTLGWTGQLGISRGGTGLSSLGTGVQTALGQNVTGSGGFVLQTGATIVTPIMQEINGTLNNRIFLLRDNASAVNSIIIDNAATGLPPTITASGSDTNIALYLMGTGNLGARLQGITSGNTIPAGYLGEKISSSVLVGSKVTLTTATPANITSINLTAGEWAVSWGLLFETAATTSVTVIRGGAATASAAVGASTVNYSQFAQQWAAFVPGVTTFQANGATATVSTGSPVTVYLNAQSTFTISNMYAYGWILARRVG